MTRRIFCGFLAAWLAAAVSLTAEVARLRDLDGDGGISPAEAEASFADEVLRRADANRDGKISRAEAKALGETDERNKEKLRRILLDFKRMDTNGDGQIDRAELAKGVHEDSKIRALLLDASGGANPSMRSGEPSDSERRAPGLAVPGRGASAQDTNAEEVTPLIGFGFKL